jgi:type I restriction enzyme S subunit
VSKLNQYSSYKDSGVEWIGEIPSGWIVRRFSYSFGFQKGKIPKDLSDEKKENYHPYLSMDVLRGGEPSQFTVGEDYVVVDKGDLGLLWDGSNSGEVISINQKGILSSTVSVLIPKDKNLKNGYSYYLLKFYESDFKNNTVGMGIPHVDGDHVKETKLLIPPLHEQHQIVEYLDNKTSSIDSLIQSKEKKIELLKEKRTSLINQVVTKGLNPDVVMKDSGVEWIGEIPREWEISKVMYVLDFYNNVRIPLSSEEREKRGGEYRYYGSTGIIDYIDDYLFDGEYILIGEDGSNLKLRTYRLSNVVSGKFWVNNHSHILKSKKGNNHYYSHLLELTDFTNYITGSTQPKLTMDNLKIVPMITPPLTEQQEIVSYLENETKLIDETISSEQKKIELLKEYKQSLISEVVTGKRKVTTDE